MALHALDRYTEVGAFAGSTSETPFRGQERHRAFVRPRRNDIPRMGQVEGHGIAKESLAVGAIQMMDILEMAGNGRRLDSIVTFLADQDSVCGEMMEKLRRLGKSS